MKSGPRPSAPPPALQVALDRRPQVDAALTALEAVVARRDAPAPDLVQALTQVRDALQEHIVAVEEGEGALLRDVVERAPHLGRAVERLREDHRTLVALADDAVAAGDQLHDPAFPELPAFARSEAMVLATRMRAHQREGAHVVYDAYDVDLGGGD